MARCRAGLWDQAPGFFKTIVGFLILQQGLRFVLRRSPQEKLYNLTFEATAITHLSELTHPPNGLVFFWQQARRR